MGTNGLMCHPLSSVRQVWGHLRVPRQQHEVISGLPVGNLPPFEPRRVRRPAGEWRRRARQLVLGEDVLYLRRCIFLVRRLLPPHQAPTKNRRGSLTPSPPPFESAPLTLTLAPLRHHPCAILLAGLSIPDRGGGKEPVVRDPWQGHVKIAA